MEIAVILPFSFLLLFIAIVILSGKGDGLIAGYNTATPKEKAQVNIHRLRLLVGIFLIVTAMVLPLFMLSPTAVALAVFTILMGASLLIVLANTWGRKK